MRIETLREAYQKGELTPRTLLAELKAKMLLHVNNPIWIYTLSDAELEPYLKRLEEASIEALPLYGIFFAIKDNIDLADIPTTAACPDFSYVPERSAYVVERLIEAGAIPLGKTNLDQFATGLVGTRSPYGICQNSINSEYISGGSSAGSAVSVALELVSFSLGTDTAGSGRVPAAFNNLIGIKPSKGVLSTSGVVPACRSLDCISLFTKTCEDAKTLFTILASYDRDDVYAREQPLAPKKLEKPLRIGIPSKKDLQFFGDREAETLFKAAVDRFIALGAVVEEVDFSPFLNAANLLYSGPWVAERYVATKALLQQSPQSFLEVTRTIIAQGEHKRASDYFEAEYALKAYRREAEQRLKWVDFMLTPTTGTIYSIAEVEANPIELNTNLGYYTNFMNLLDLCALALPAGERENGLPFGITIFADAFEDEKLLTMGEIYTKELACKR